jgi:hypothetical protein
MIWKTDLQMRNSKLYIYIYIYIYIYMKKKFEGTFFMFQIINCHIYYIDRY